MRLGSRARKWGIVLGVAAIAAGVGLSGAVGTAFAGKPPPPPASNQRIYYQVSPSDGVWHSMDTAGANKTALASAAGIGLSREMHGGAYLSVFLQPSAANGTTPSPYNEPLPDLAVQPVNSTASVVVVPGGRLQFNEDSRACFLPGDDTILTFTAIEWDEARADVLWAGFYEVTLTYDGSGAVTGATAPTLLFTIPWEVQNLSSGPVHRLNCRTRFDWLDPTTVVWARQGATVTLRILKTVVPAAPADYATCSVEVVAEEAWGPVAVNPSRSRLTFCTNAGMVETDATGGNRYLWVALTYSGGGRNQKRYNPQFPCYADDNTVVYTYQVTYYGTATSTWDAYIVKRGGTGTNLSGDVSEWLATWAVR